MRGLAYNIEQGYLPDRHGVTDGGQFLELNPNSSKYWQCDYCAFRTLCAEDGPGQVRIIDSAIAEKSE